MDSNFNLNISSNLKKKISKLEKELKKANEKILELTKTVAVSKHSYKEIFNGINDAVFVHPLSSEGFNNFIDVNENAINKYGYTREEFLDISLPDITISSSSGFSENYNEREKLLKNKTAVLESVHLTKSGEKFPVEISSKIINLNNQQVVISVVRDITKRKNFEKGLIESERTFRDVFYTSPDSISLSRLSDGLYLDINNGFTEITGFTREEVIGRTVADISIWKNSKERVLFAKELAETGRVEKFKTKFRKKNGEVIIGLLSARILD